VKRQRGALKVEGAREGMTIEFNTRHAP
jgi:hypothetical protein